MVLEDRVCLQNSLAGGGGGGVGGGEVGGGRGRLSGSSSIN